MKLYTIGFTKSSARDFFLRLKHANVSIVLDTRANRTSQLSGFSKENDLKFFLSEINSIQYRVESILAPDSNLLKAYRQKEMGWDEYARLYLDGLNDKRVEARLLEGSQLDHACLLCSEHEPSRCHRRLAAEYLRDASNQISIKHL